MVLAHSSLDFSHALHYPQSNWALLVLLPEWVGLCTSSPVSLGVSPAAASIPQVFAVSGLRLYFSMLELWVVRSVTWSTSCCLPGQLQLCPPRSTIRHLAGSASCSLAACPLRPAARLHPASRLHPSYWFLLYLLGCRTSMQFDFLSVPVVSCF